MKDTDILHRYTYLRLLLPLVAGIACGCNAICVGSRWVPALFFTLFILLAAAQVAVYSRKSVYSLRWLFGAVVVADLFSLGAAVSSYNMYRVRDGVDNERHTYVVKLTSFKQIKPRTLLFDAKLLAIADSAGMRKMRRQPSVMLYLAGDSLSGCLTANDELLVNAPVSAEQDGYNLNLYRNSICGTLYADSLHWRFVRHGTGLTMRQRASLFRDRLVEHYRCLGFDGDNLAVLSAITLGYKQTMDSDLKESYSVAGASHVLAISGMHIGVIYALLVFLLGLVTLRSPALEWVRGVAIIIILWLYTYFIGLPASAIRASTMFSLYLIAKLSNRDALPLNNLFASAFVMLIVRPLWLFDVGFQLSFAAVGSILLFNPLISKLCKPGNRVLRMVWSVLTVTLSAQIGAMPLIAYYFHALPSYFMLTNLVILPLITLIVYGVAAMWALSFIPSLQMSAAGVIDFMLTTLNGGVRLIESLPHSSFGNIYINIAELFLLYVSLLAIYLLVRERSGRNILIALGMVALLALTHVGRAIYTAPQSGIEFSRIAGMPMVQCISSDRRSWVVVPDSAEITPSVRRRLSNQCLNRGLKQPAVKQGDGYGEVAGINQIITYKHKRILFLTDNRWNKKSTVSPMKIDYLYICRGYTGDMSALAALFSVRHVVVDSSLSEYRRDKCCEWCRKYGVDYRVVPRNTSVAIRL